MTKPNAYLEREWRSMRLRINEALSVNRADMTDQAVSFPVGIYTDPERFQAEKDILFRMIPLLAGFSSEVAAPGDVMLFDGAGPGIFITRRDDGSLSAFLNVCPHRGARMVREAERRHIFSCPYHAWSFSPDGALIKQPLAECFEGHNSVSLTPVPVAEKYGMVFVRAAPSGAPIDVDEFLGPMAPLMESLELTGATPVAKDTHPAQTNWKLALDTGCEGYHVPATHTRSIAPQLVPFLTIHDSFGLHHRYCSPQKVHLDAVGKPEVDWPHAYYGAVHYIFPNTVFSYTQAIDGAVPVLALLRLFPGDHPGECSVVFNLYKPADAAHQNDAPFQALHQAIIAINQNEDLVVAREVWENYRRLDPSTRMVFGRNEMVLQRYHAQIADVIGMPIGAE